MTLKEAYLHLQQGLQTIAAFVYRDVLEDELDYFWNQGTNKFIQLVFPDEDSTGEYSRFNERYEKIQVTLDDLRVLEILGYNLVGLSDFTFGNYSGKFLPLPINYRHLLNDRTIVKPIDCDTDETREVPNRLTKTNILNNVLENSIYKTSLSSPISHLSGNRLYIYSTYKNKEEFTIENIYFDYLKKPDIVTYGSTGSTILQFPDDVCFKIIDITLIYISIVAEQNPQKIQGLLRVRQ